MRAAIYARFSTDKQSEASIDDQIRVCERLASRHGFEVVERYSDKAISGGTTQRPGYQQLLTGARGRRFEVIIAEDTSRLWRLLAEQAPRLAELLDLGVHVVTHDLDTRQDSADILGAVNGAMAQQYRKEISRRTRRGLEGCARANKSTGGRAYGYRSASESASGQREPIPEQAEIVRTVFELYADGWSARSIAIELNQRGVPSPGSTWNRTTRRRKGWTSSAIAGDPVKGVGLLNNELYVGRVVWNRVRWVRSAADAARRKCIPNPPGEWIVREDPSLRIVSQELWERVKARQRQQSTTVGVQVREGVRRDRAHRHGRGPKYLFSGLLKCSVCGANFIMAGRSHYACASRLIGAECSNDVYLRKSEIETGLLAGIKRTFLSAEAVDEVIDRVSARLRAQRPADDGSAQRVAQLEQQVTNLTDAIASGALRTSPAIAERLSAAEKELASLNARAAAVALDVDVVLPQLRTRFARLVERLEQTLAVTDVNRSRTELTQLVGPIRVVSTPTTWRLEAQKGRPEATLLGQDSCQETMVAGAGFEPATFGL